MPTFDALEEVKPHVLFHLEALKEWGAEVFFISNSDLPTQETTKLQPLVHRILLRENRGMDFGMWKEALESVNLDCLDELGLSAFLQENGLRGAVTFPMDASGNGFVHNVISPLGRKHD